MQNAFLSLETRRETIPGAKKSVQPRMARCTTSFRYDGLEGRVVSGAKVVNRRAIRCVGVYRLHGREIEWRRGSKRPA